MPLLALLYAQVVKTMRRRRLVAVKHLVVFAQLAIEQVLVACGWQINTAFVERLNLSLRQRVAAIGGAARPRVRAKTACASNWRSSRCITISSCPHASLRQALAAPVATNGCGSVKVWRPRTPAMAAGLTDHVWSLKEVLFACHRGHSPRWPEK